MWLAITGAYSQKCPHKCQIKQTIQSRMDRVCFTCFLINEAHCSWKKNFFISIHCVHMSHSICATVMISVDASKKKKPVCPFSFVSKQSLTGIRHLFHQFLFYRKQKVPYITSHQVIFTHCIVNLTLNHSSM